MRCVGLIVTVPGLHCGEGTARNRVHQEVNPEAQEVLRLHQECKSNSGHRTGHFIPRCQIPEHYYQGICISYTDHSDSISVTSCGSFTFCEYLT